MLGKINKIALFLVLTIMFSCGYEKTEFRPGYYFYIEETGSELVQDLFNDVVDFWENHYGKTLLEVNIMLRKEHWTYAGMEVAGLYLGGGTESCTIVIGIDHKSECETAKIMWHELYHCVFNDYDHFIGPGEESRIYALDKLPEGTTNWTWGLTYMEYDFRDLGMCREGEEELYIPYPFI